MKPGRKAEPPATKGARGTLKPYRDDGRTELMVPGSPPAQPDYLTAEAIDVWQEEIGRVMAAGVAEIDSSLFARYCSLEALVRLVERWDLIVLLGSIAGAFLGYWAAWYFDRNPKAE